MWTRKELKSKGKSAFLVNYWKTVLVSFILFVIVGGAAGSVGGFGGQKSSSGIESAINNGSAQEAQEFGSDLYDKLGNLDIPTEAIFIIAGVVGLIIIIGIAIGLIINAFLVNPFEIGCKRFFTRNLNQKASISEITFAFDNNYLNNVKTTFFRDLYTMLWTLLFIIPGIVKNYEYRMIPYILADHPEMTMKDVFAKSKEMMKGQKWRAFVLDLSFIGWEILSFFTAGLLGLFYVSPYRNMTNAALYERLEYGNITVEENV